MTTVDIDELDEDGNDDAYEELGLLGTVATAAFAA